jgi:hypothetical protein
MTTVIHETENAVFEFSLSDTTERLKSSKHNVEDATDLLHFLSFSLDDPIKVPEEKTYFGFTAMDLIREGKGIVICKICQKTYQPDQLKPVVLGAGESPFKVKLPKRGGIKAMFRKKMRISMFGGKGYKCPEGHALIAMITWIT